MSKIYIVFPVHNGIESTLSFLDDLEKQTITNFEVIMCDDGSIDGTKEIVNKRYPDVKVLEGSGNLWWTAGINLCVKYVLQTCDEEDFILTINNDVQIDGDYLSRKLTRANSHPDAIFGSVCVFMTNHKLIETSGFIMDYKKCTSRSLTKRGEVITAEHKGVKEVTHLPGKGVLLPVSVYKSVGFYDEDNLPQYHADTDLILMAHEAGYKVYVDFDSVIYSDVNLTNMTIPSDQLTVSNVLKTFRGRYTPNNYKIIKYFGIKHFQKRWWIYVIKVYIKIIGGMLLRYIKYKLNKAITYKSM